MNNAHQVPALSKVQEYEVALRLATRLMNSKNHVIANLECTNVKQQHIINQQGQTLMERDQKIDQLEHMVHG
ncbi:hypothetical protein GGF41_001536 [Coemansia sp. RSA 2531]|nr:hypothetical protein GGF41_001536 [Coemansia sp. RSA 2531]